MTVTPTDWSRFASAQNGDDSAPEVTTPVPPDPSVALVFGGRPVGDGYEAWMARSAEQACKLGATDVEVAEILNISTRCLQHWKVKHEDLALAMQAGKAIADSRVERSLFNMAVGYTYDSEKIVTVAQGGGMGSEIERVPITEHVPPSVQAQMFWLKNRKPQEWRERQSIEHSGPGGAPILTISAEMTLKEAADAYAHSIDHES